MTDAPRPLRGTALPPIVLGAARVRRAPGADLVPRLTRLACALAALALPALGAAVTDTVHRARVPGAVQAVAPAIGGAAAAPATRTRPPVRVAALGATGDLRR